MSANLDLVRSIYAAWERGDFSRAEWANPGIEYVLPDTPEGASWRGLSGMASAHRDFLSAWGGWQVEAEDYVEIDSQRVLLPFRYTALGKRSGLEIDDSWRTGASLFEIRHGRVTRLVNYFHRDRAFADLGLASQTDTDDPPG